MSRLTKRALLAVVPLMAVPTILGVAPASAFAPCSTGPNYRHFDADAVDAAKTGVKVTGHVYWDSYSTGTTR